MEMPYQEAIQEGATALFGEKYGEVVRVLKINDFSTELCGGTHVDRTGEIGMFKILSDSSVAAGIRRIEALTGQGALHYVRSLEERWENLSRKLKSTPEEISDKIEKQLELLKKYEKEVAQLKSKLASSAGTESTPIENQIEEIKGTKVLALRRDVDDIQALRGLSDQLMAKISSGILVLGSGVNGKATLIVRVSKDVTRQFNASELAKKLATLVGGSGGGRPDMAQAGGPLVEKLDEALGEIRNFVLETKK
jgi:alanyl-tRNA synthetase